MNQNTDTLGRIEAADSRLESEDRWEVVYKLIQERDRLKEENAALKLWVAELRKKLGTQRG